MAKIVKQPSTERFAGQVNGLVPHCSCMLSAFPFLNPVLELWTLCVFQSQGAFWARERGLMSTVATCK